MNRIEELTAKRAVIDEEIRNLQKDMQAPAIKQARDILKAVGLQLVKTAPIGSKTPAKKVAPKFVDPASGQTWSGRGKPPVWVRTATTDQLDAMRV